MAVTSTSLLEALDDKALIAASSANIFARGKTYAQSGAVAITDEDPLPEPAVRAEISGTELYSVEVRVGEGRVAGDCDCAHGAEGWFCKHQVSLALVWRQRLTGAVLALDETARKKVAASVKRAQTLKTQVETLHNFLHAQSAMVLADKLLALAELDSSIKRSLQSWQKVSAAQDNPAELKKAVTGIMAGSGFLDHHQSRAYARRAGAVLPLLERARTADAASAVALAMHALRRCWRVMENADDSNGEIGDLSQAIGISLIAALKAAGPQAEKFGKSWFELIDEDPFGFLNQREAEAAIGDKALAHYRKLIAEHWQRALDTVLTMSAATRRNAYAYDGNDPRRILNHYQRLHLAQLQSTGDIPGSISVLKANLHDAHAHDTLIHFFDQHGLHREAFGAAEAAYKAFPDDWRIENRLLACFERDGWHKEALALNEARFKRQPTLAHYQTALASGPAAGKSTEALRDALLSLLTASENAQFETERKRPSTYRSPGYDVSMRLEIYCAEKCWADALAILQGPAHCNRRIMHALALELPAAHKADALRLLKSLFASEMQQANSPYRAALELVEQVCKRLSVSERNTWLKTLRVEHKAKRNFLAGLPNT